MFRLKKWDDPQTWRPVRFNDAKSAPQDILQVWFAGVHSDIGGGYPEKQSALSKYPLLWMIDEAEKIRPQINHASVNQLAWGIPRKNSPFSYVAPDVCGEVRDFAARGVEIFEFLPKKREHGNGRRGEVFRVLHSGCGAAADFGRRGHSRVRGEADGEGGAIIAP